MTKNILSPKVLYEQIKTTLNFNDEVFKFLNAALHHSFNHEQFVSFLGGLNHGSDYRYNDEICEIISFVESNYGYEFSIVLI